MRIIEFLAGLFQFTPLREGRLRAFAVNGGREVFQFTPLREGRHEGAKFRVIGVISIHAPPRGATPLAGTGGSPKRFQFTPLREGRRGKRNTAALRANFNSRPSARGDVIPNGGAVARKKISIHAPPRGATPNAGFIDAEQDAISIHAPPRGATPFPASHCPRCTHFNSRPSARGDVMENGNCAVERFQFTPLREGRRNSWARGRRTGHFNSRPSARGDVTLSFQMWEKVISIHAPPRGATRACAFALPHKLISIHAPPRGATAGLRRRRICWRIFQFTPLREGRRLLLAIHQENT